MKISTNIAHHETTNKFVFKKSTNIIWIIFQIVISLSKFSIFNQYNCKLVNIHVMLNTCFVSICISRMLRIWCVISIYQSSLQGGETKKAHFFATHVVHSRSLPKKWNIVHYIHYKKTWFIWWKNLIKKPNCDIFPLN